MSGHLTIVVGPGVLPDPAACGGVLDRALAAWDAGGRLVLTGSSAQLRAEVAAAGDGEVVVLPGPAVDVDALDLPGTATVLRVDLADRARDPSPRVRRHLRGRGAEGIRYAVDAWAVQRAAPGVRHAYGPDADQHADLRLPSGPPPGPAGYPVAVLVHGGYWRSRWESDLMEPMAVDLTARGLATWNVEYRRPDEHDWSATTADVAAALGALVGVDAPLDLGRVVMLGHSAGGQLVTRLAADVAADPAAPVRPALTVSLAGVLDLAEADRRRLGGGAVADALRGHAGDLPALYRASSPVERLPIGLPVAVVCGTGDDPDLLDLSRAFARAAAAAGDDVVVVEGDGDHFAVIDPRSAMWSRVVEVVRTGVGPPR